MYKRQIIYNTEDGKTKINVRIIDETVWLTQNQICELFQTSKSNLSEHIKNIFDDEELKKESVVRKFRITANDGKEYNVLHYNLDLIISVGYRIRSKIATNFRKWATENLKEYIIKGFLLDDERLKNNGSGNYFKELLDRIRDIRSSEKIFYRQVLDLFATSIDYDSKSDEAKKFFATVQNKLHYAVHHNTATELIFNRVDSNKDFMGLTVFKGELPTLKEAKIAKNYLTEDELKNLNTLVSGYLDFAELQAKKRKVMTMKNWNEHINSILIATGEDLLKDNGKISKEQMNLKVNEEYKKFSKKNLTQVEKDYLEELKNIEKVLNKK